MLNPELLEVLCCPESRQALRLATPKELASVNQPGALTRAARSVALPISGGLVRSDGSILYPIWDGIPCLLAEQGILLEVLEPEGG